MLTLYIADAEKDVSMKNLSRKEAITLLRNLEDSLDSYCELNEEGKTAFRMAIEALSCSEIPNNSDTISRRKAFEYFVALWECIGTIMDRDEWEDVCMTTANEIPSAEPKRGKWILDRSGAYCCDRCMEPCAGYVMMKPRDKFCKMCGQRMEGGD